MSVNEILAELEKLSPDELSAVREKLDLVEQELEETPEMHAAIDVGWRSLQEERTYSYEEAQEELRKWRLDSK